MLVELCDFADYAVLNLKNTNWDNYSNRLSITTDIEGTLLSRGDSNGYYFVKIGNEKFVFEDFIAEFDVVSIKNQCILYYQSQNPTLAQDVMNLSSHNVVGKRIRMISQNGITRVYANDVQIGNDITNTVNVPFEMGFRLNTTQSERSFKFKNFRLHKL